MGKNRARTENLIRDFYFRANITLGLYCNRVPARRVIAREMPRGRFVG
jgi:hypothetical protein